MREGGPALYVSVGANRHQTRTRLPSQWSDVYLCQLTGPRLRHRRFRRCSSMNGRRSVLDYTVNNNRSTSTVKGRIKLHLRPTFGGPRGVTMPIQNVIFA